MLSKPVSLTELNFDNRFIRDLPADPEPANYRRQIKGACYSRVAPTPVANPELVSYSKATAKLLNLSNESCESNLLPKFLPEMTFSPAWIPMLNVMAVINSVSGRDN